MSRARPPCHNIGQTHLRITDHLHINRVYVFYVHISTLIIRWCPYSNVNAVDGSDYIWKLAHRCELQFNVGLLTDSEAKCFVPG